MKVTRRELAAALASAPVLAQAQTRPSAAPAAPDGELQAARERIRNNSEALARVAVPMTTEPAFQFKA